MKEKELLFSLTAKDFKWEFFKSSGAGGQNKNKRDTACRCIHPPSGAIGIGTEEREQGKNRRTAFKRCVESDVFKKWHKIECARQMLSLAEKRKIEAYVEKELNNKNNLKIEIKDSVGKWIDEKEMISTYVMGVK